MLCQTFCTAQLISYMYIYICSFLDSLPIQVREGNGTPLQYSCLENPMTGGAWQAAVHGAAKSRTRLSDFTFTFHFHALEKEMATHSSVLAWRIPGTAEPGGLPSMGSQSRTRLTRLSSPFRSPQSIQQSSLCYTVSSRQLSILYTVSIVYMCQSQSPNSSHPDLSFLKTQ